MCVHGPLERWCPLGQVIGVEYYLPGLLLATFDQDSPTVFCRFILSVLRSYEFISVILMHCLMRLPVAALVRSYFDADHLSVMKHRHTTAPSVPSCTSAHNAMYWSKRNDDLLHQILHLVVSYSCCLCNCDIYDWEVRSVTVSACGLCHVCPLLLWGDLLLRCLLLPCLF